MMTYEYDAARSIIHLRATGIVVASDPITYFRQLDEDHDFVPQAEERIYFTEVEDIKFSFLDIVAIRNAFEKYRHGDKISHGVFVVDSDMSYGMARMVISVFAGSFDAFTIERVEDGAS